MALLEINLRKPALVEETVEAEPARKAAEPRAKSKMRGGGSVLGKLAMVGAILAVVAVARKLRGWRSSKSSEPEGVEVPIEDGSSKSSGRSKRLRVLGMVLAVLGAAAAARRMQNSGRR